MIGEGESVSWEGTGIKGQVHKRKLTKKMFLNSSLLTSLTSSLTQLCLTIIKNELPGNGEKDRELLTNQTVLYTRLTHETFYQDILEFF